MIKHEDMDDGPLTSKCHKVCFCHSCCFPCNFLFHPCRKAVSGKKKRLIQDGFDLDLAHITPRIIVHGFPAAGLEHMYRNPRYEIRRYMNLYYKDNFKMFNFCCEPGRGYDPAIFDGRVERYPFKDHNTPPLATMAAFANSAKLWLDEDPKHVVNMHCKAGKGRAGLMCCVLLVRMGVVQSAKEAMDLYDKERVTNNRGLTVTSQRKYVVFYEMLWRKVWGVTGNIGDVPAEPVGSDKYAIPKQPELKLYGVDVLNIARGLFKEYRVTIYRLTNFNPERVFDSGYVKGDVPSISCEVLIEGNFKIYLETRKSAFNKSVKLFELLHNTFFMEVNAMSQCDFPVDQLDIKKKVKPKVSNMVVRLNFTPSASGSDTNKGYSLVSRNGNDEADLQGAKSVSSSSIGVELTHPTKR